MKTEVYCYGCQESHNTKTVEFLHIEENPDSHDVMTFFCANSQYKGISSVRGKAFARTSNWF
jgi:hypothetical protein